MCLLVGKVILMTDQAANIRISPAKYFLPRRGPLISMSGAVQESPDISFASPCNVDHQHS